VSTRKIIRIDEEKCNGCGQCVLACAEGAIQVIDGKARLISESYCDGLGACLGECPQDALIIEEREAEQFDPEAVEQHLAEPAPAAARPAPHGHVCPGAAAQMLRQREAAAGQAEAGGPAPSLLQNWPVQLTLAPVQAPHYDGAHLVISADCAPFAFADFHRQFLSDTRGASGPVLLIGCPKLDEGDFYRQKLAQIFARNDIESVEVVHMEVP
jgi:Pyruvate/2-oxoacid:ferredoxin oxidoreductase delta subunit